MYGACIIRQLVANSSALRLRCLAARLLPSRGADLKIPCGKRLELVAIDSGTAESLRQLKTLQFKNRFQDLRPGSSALQMDPQFCGEVHSGIRIS